jgi:Fic family protein
MTEPETNIHVLDAAYRPFPAFAEWAAKTSVDTVRWDRYMAELGSRQPTSSDAQKAYDVVKRAAAVDTGAIEGLYDVDRGFTFTVAFQTTAWELEVAKKGEHFRSLFEAQMHAYDYVLNLATKAEPISEAAIRTLHQVVCEAQSTYRVQTAVGPQEQALVKGRYKVLPNHVRTRDGVDHSYAPVDVTPAEMARLVAEMRSEAFLASHPVIQAAYSHFGLVVIHPFADGNGRVARALASAFTYRAISMPIMILSEHKGTYLDALEVADQGDYQPFVDFMLARSLDTITLVRESMFGGPVPNSEDAAAEINRLFITKGGYSEAQVENAGDRLLDLLSNESRKVIAKNTGPNLRGSDAYAIMPGVRTAPDSGHRLPTAADSASKFLRIEFTSAPPAQARLARTYAVWLPADAAGDDDFKIVSVEESAQLDSFSPAQTVFTARVEELIPSTSGVLQIRVGILADRLVSELLLELAAMAKKALQRDQS